MNSKDIRSTISQGFPPNMVKQETIVLRKMQNFCHLNTTEIRPSIRTKEESFKNAWSQAKIKRPQGLTEGSAIFLSHNHARSKSFDRKNGTACLGTM